MKWSEWLDKWSMNSLKISAGFLEMEFCPNDNDKNAAWQMYIDLLTRITTQPIDADDGDELTALKSIHGLFGLTRTVIKEYGRHGLEFTKIAIVVLNQIIRPFTAKWHKISLNNGFDDQQTCLIFRKELDELQKKLRVYTRMLGEMSGVEEDLLNFESKI